MNTASAYIDRRELDRLYGPIADELMSELAVEFRADATSAIAEATELLATRNAEGMRRLAHTLRGAAAAMAAVDLAGLCGSLEELMSSGGWPLDVGVAEQAVDSVIVALGPFETLQWPQTA